MAEFALDEIENLLMGYVTGGSNDQLGGSEPLAEAFLQSFFVEFFDGIGSAENGAAKRMIGPEATGKKFVEQVFGIVQIHLDFFEDDLAFFLDVFGVEFGAKDEISENVEGDGEMLVENFGVEADLFFGSESVEHAADRVHFTSDAFCGAAFGAFENHVLHEVGEAVFFRSFAARAVANPNADRDGAYVRHGLSDDNQAVGQDVFLDVARFGGHFRIVTQGGKK